MHAFFKTLVVLAAAAAVATPAVANLAVFATVPEWGALAQELGGDKVDVYTATNALQDPHHVEAKPSLIAKARKADLVVATGAELEIGWLPLVLPQAGNPKVQPGQPGYFEAASFVTTIELPARIDRAEGDVHPQGNPHIQTDPRNIARVAAALVQRMAELDPADAAAFRARYASFDAALGEAGGTVTRHARTRAAQGVFVPACMARHDGNGRPGAEARRRADRRVAIGDIGATAARAGEDGDPRRVPERSRVAMDRR